MSGNISHGFYSHLAGKLSVYTLQNLHHSGKLYLVSGKTFLHMNRTTLFDLSKCFLGNRDNFCPYEEALIPASQSTRKNNEHRNKIMSLLCMAYMQIFYQTFYFLVERPLIQNDPVIRRYMFYNVQYRFSFIVRRISFRRLQSRLSNNCGAYRE